MVVAKMNGWLDHPGMRVLQFIFQALVVPLLVFMISMLLAHDREITEMKANRYTATDALRDQTAIWKAFADINVKMAELPPDTFEQYVDQIDERVRQLEIQQANHHGRRQGGRNE